MIFPGYRYRPVTVLCHTLPTVTVFGPNLLVLGKSPFGLASRSHFWPSQRMTQKKLAGPIMAGLINGPAISPAIIPVQQNWPRNLAQPKLGQQLNFGPTKKWKKLAQPKIGPAIIGPVKFWPSQNFEKIGPAKFWLLAQVRAFRQH